jgi:hypothetical protein
MDACVSQTVLRAEPTCATKRRDYSASLVSPSILYALVAILGVIQKCEGQATSNDAQQAEDHMVGQA